MAAIRQILSVVAVLILALGWVTTAESQSYVTSLRGGQGLGGTIKLHVDWNASADLVVTIDQMNLAYVPHAPYNNIDDTYQDLQVKGLLLVPQSVGGSAGPNLRVLVPFVHVQSANGILSCTACGSGVVPNSSVAASKGVIAGFVVNNIIMLMPEVDLAQARPADAVGVANTGAVTGSAGLAEIARTANLPLASLPNLMNLQADDYSLLQSAAASIKDATGMDDVVKSTLLSAVMQAANMAYSPSVQKFVLEKFGLESKIIFQGVLADPIGYAHEAGNGASTDLLKGVAIDIAGQMTADAIFSIKPLADMSPEWKVPMHAMVKATVVELANLARSTGDPSEAVQGIAARIYDFYQIYKASVGLADDQNEALVQTAVSLETAARLVTLNPSPKNTDIARSTVADAVTNLKQVFGDNYSVAMTDIVNLTFVGLLSDLRGDPARARLMVVHIREAGKLGADDGMPSPLAHPLNWIASVASWSGDPTSRAAALMISTTMLGDLGTGDSANAATAQAAAAPKTGRWGPDIIPAQGFSDAMRQCDGQACLKALGMTQSAIDFTLAAFSGNPGMGAATAFRELGAVDWVQAAVIYSPYEATMLVNGTPDIIWPEMTRDMAATFSDSASQAMLRQFPKAMIIGGDITGYRKLPNGRQRFVFNETVFDACHACPILGGAISFLEFDSTGKQVERRAVGLDLSPPDQTAAELTPQLIKQMPDVLQVTLNNRGYDAGPIDGAPGPQSRQALMEFQVEHCLPPTGQLDDKTADTLLSADKFAAPCADARLPAGISANTPLLSGVYVDNPENCKLDALGEVENATGLYIIRGLDHQSGGYDQVCTVRRTDLIRGVTKFSGDCSVEGSTPGPNQWIAELKANDAFTVWYGDQTGKGQSFARCADDSALAKTNSVGTAASAPAPATLPEKATDIRAYCAAQTDAPGPGEDGSKDPEVLKAGGNTWRCMNGKVLVCDEGGTGAGCIQTTEVTPQIKQDLKTYCQENVNSDFIPMYLTAGLRAVWHCNGREPAETEVVTTDRLGYKSGAWLPLDAQPAAATATAPAASAGGADQASALLKSIAGRAFEGDVRTHPADKYAPNANYFVQIDVDGQAQATYRGGIHAPPWPCVGSLTPVAVAGTQALFNFTRTSGNDDFIIRCPDTGRLQLDIGSASGPLGFTWLSLGADNASGSLDALDAASYAAQQPPPDVNPCAESVWTGTVQEPEDLFLCNQSRAMALFANEQDMMFKVPDTGLTLRDGWYYASYTTRGTAVENTVQSMSVNGIKDWGQWMKVTNAQLLTVTCTFNAANNPDLSPGKRAVKAKLVQFSGGNLLFACR